MKEELYKPSPPLTVISGLERDRERQAEERQTDRHKNRIIMLLTAKRRQHVN